MSTPSAYQRVVTQYDITEAGVPSIAYANYDGVDDILPITLPAITGGTVALVGLNGIWIEDDWDYAGGTLSIGPTTIDGLPAGILDVVGDLCAVIINDRAWTAAERAGVVAWGKARGAPGVFELGAELVTNGTFDTDTAGWVSSTTLTATLSQSAGEMVVTTGANYGRAVYDVSAPIISVFKTYLISGDITAIQATKAAIIGAASNFAANNPIAFQVRTTPGRMAAIYKPVSSVATILAGSNSIGVGDEFRFDNISLKELELIP